MAEAVDTITLPQFGENRHPVIQVVNHGNDPGFVHGYATGDIEQLTVGTQLQATSMAGTGYQIARVVSTADCHLWLADAWLPNDADIQGLDALAWLDAFDLDGVVSDGAEITDWADKSGNDNDATGTAGTAPTYDEDGFNGYPTANFDGTEFLVTPDLDATGEFTIFVVSNSVSQVHFSISGEAEITDAGTIEIMDADWAAEGAVAGIKVRVSGATESANNGVFEVASVLGDVLTLDVPAETMVTETVAALTVIADVSDPLISDTDYYPRIMSSISSGDKFITYYQDSESSLGFASVDYDITQSSILTAKFSGGAVPGIWLNGALEVASSNSKLYDSAAGFSVLKIGAYSTYFHIGDIAELLICNTALDWLQIAQVNGYLAHKFGLTSLLDSDHVRKTLPQYIPLPAGQVRQIAIPDGYQIMTRGDSATGTLNIRYAKELT